MHLTLFENSLRKKNKVTVIRKTARFDLDSAIIISSVSKAVRLYCLTLLIMIAETMLSIRSVLGITVAFISPP